MAVTKLLRIKETSGKNKTKHLQNNIFYICQDKKTDCGKWIGGNAGSTPAQILKTMNRNKCLWNKESGTQAFHYMLSFPPEENVSEELAMQITEEFCQELLGDAYYHVIAVHNDRAHMHSHITFDSVNRLTGRKFHSPKGDWEKRMQPITDRLCRKYKLTSLQYDPEHVKGKNYQEWESAKTERKEDGSNQNKYSWYDIIRDDIDEAIAKTDSWEGFLEYLKNQNYEIRQGQYLSFKPYGKERAVRTHQLGEGYGKEDIMRRIRLDEKQRKGKENIKTYGDRVFIQKIFIQKKSIHPRWHLSPFQRQFYQRWSFTYFIRKPGYPNAWKYKKDILKVEKLAEQLSYLIDHDINSDEDLQLRKEKIQKEKRAVQKLQQEEAGKLRSKKTNLLAAEYIKCKQELAQFPEGTRTDLMEQLNRLASEIEKTAPLQQVIAEYQKRKEKIESCKKEWKKLNRELLILKRIEDSGPKAPEYVENRSKHAGMEEPDINKNAAGHTRITINEKLFAFNFKQTEQEGFYCTKIPYTKSYVKYEKADCQLQNEDSILSVYLYDDKEYILTDEAGTREWKVLGRELKEKYEDKTKPRQKNGKVGISGNMRESRSVI